MAEVVGDVGDVLGAGTLGPFGRRLRYVAVTVTRLSVRRASAVHYVTDQVLQDRYPAGRDVPTWAFSDVVIPDDVPDWAGKEARLEIIAVGSQEQMYKGHDQLIRAVARLRLDVPGVALRLIGDGRCQPRLVALSEELEVSDIVEFSGWLGHREVFDMVSRAAVFAMPSTTEGRPRALVEAMYVGLPAVGTRVGGIVELLQDEDLVEVGDLDRLCHALRRYLTDQEAANQASQRNRRHVESSLAASARARESWSAGDALAVAATR
ncbi:glycosyltransferase [Nocardioides albidus]|uniref:glycosyltransferase n=1 Tax=Nocardioides albidus TaxID=1517589 RepID=UPI0013052FF5|nr:glycosyltransferase [Nocardioides albidus]